MVARVGIDLGTTNTVVSLVDRGNYPVLDLNQGVEPRLHIPTLIAFRGRDLRIGWEALEVWNETGWELLGSPKRWLGVPEPEILEVENPGETLEELLYQYFVRLREKILQCPHLSGEKEVQAILGVPANSNSLQRLRTLQAAKRAGFLVDGLLHEPTAAAIEYTHRNPSFGKSKKKRHILVYDLGGGTFDAALIEAREEGFTVVRSAGIERLGGDDFDEIMASLALEKLGREWKDLSWSDHYRLLMRCRVAKEALQGTTRKWLLDLEDINLGEVSLYREEYYKRCLPLIDQTVELLQLVLKEGKIPLKKIDALLLVGGGSQMPIVRRRLKEVVGTRLKISPHPFASTAIGLAIYADSASNCTLSETFSRHFGVWREAEHGKKPIFDPIFARETPLPPPGKRLVVIRKYHPTHNIGHFQFEECATLDKTGNPIGHRTAWCKILFPFDPALPSNDKLLGRKVVRYSLPANFQVEEQYECDSQGMITVRLVRSNPPLSRSYLLHGPELITLEERVSS